MPVLGNVIGTLDRLIRFFIVPGAVATLAIQVAPDGRKPHRYAASWVDFKLRPRRHSVGRAVSADGRTAPYAPELWVSPDQHAGALRRARVRGPGLVRFHAPVAVRRRGRRGRSTRASASRAAMRCSPTPSSSPPVSFWRSIRERRGGSRPTDRGKPGALAAVSAALCARQSAVRPWRRTRRAVPAADELLSVQGDRRQVGGDASPRASRHHHRCRLLAVARAARVPGRSLHRSGRRAARRSPPGPGRLAATSRVTSSG